MKWDWDKFPAFEPAGLFDEGDGDQDSLPEEDEKQDDDEFHNSQDDHCKTMNETRLRGLINHL